MLIYQCDRCGAQNPNHNHLDEVRVPLRVYHMVTHAGEDAADQSPKVNICKACIDSFQETVQRWLAGDAQKGVVKP